jgi:hypothetical protein
VRASLSSFVAPTGTVSLRSTGGPAAQLSPTKCKLKAVPTAPGTASCSVKFTPLQPLVYSITARYGGDSKYPSGTGTTVVSTPRTPTSTHVSCSPAALAVTATTHCTATVGGVSGHPPSLVPKANGGSVGPAACSAGGGTETCTFSFSSGAPGTHTVSAHYPGDANDAPSSGSTTVAFAGPTMTSVTCSPARISTTQTSTCYATVTQITGPATPPAVNFSTQGGGTTYGPEKCTISSSRTVELCTAGLTSVGTGYYEAVATFPGDADAAISTGYAPLLVVNPDAIVVSCTMANVCTAVVTDTSAIPNLPTGTVTWTANPTPPKTMFSGGGQCTLTQFGSSASVALCSVDFTAPPGSYLITGHYTGDQGHDPISGQTTAH